MENYDLCKYYVVSRNKLKIKYKECSGNFHANCVDMSKADLEFIKSEKLCLCFKKQKKIVLGWNRGIVLGECYHVVFTSWLSFYQRIYLNMTYYHKFCSDSFKEAFLSYIYVVTR